MNQVKKLFVKNLLTDHCRVLTEKKSSCVVVGRKKDAILSYTSMTTHSPN